MEHKIYITFSYRNQLPASYQLFFRKRIMMTCLHIVSVSSSMESGASCWMTTLSTHTRMAWSSNAMMGCIDAFSLGYLHIQQIIQRSKPLSSCYTVSRHLSVGRVLLATIRDKGNCPCPRCLTPKSLFNRIGYAHDLSQRIKQLRTYFADKVSQARNAIYTRGAPIKGSLVEALLKPLSLVPTVVSMIYLCICPTMHLNVPLEQLCGSPLTIGFQSFPHHCGGPATRI